MGWTSSLNVWKVAFDVYIAALTPGGVDFEHSPLPVRAGDAGLRPFAVAPFSIHVCSVKYASELTSRIEPPAWSTSSGRNRVSGGSFLLKLVRYSTVSRFGSPGMGSSDATALMSSSGCWYGPYGASRSRRFCTFSNEVTSKLPAANA